MENRRDLGDFWVRVEIWNLGLVYEKGKLGLSIERERERFAGCFVCKILRGEQGERVEKREGERPASAKNKRHGKWVLGVWRQGL